MSHAVVKAAAAREVESNLVKLGLQLERSDVASRRMGEETRRTTHASPDYRERDSSVQTEEDRCIANGVGYLIMPLVEGEELLRRDRIMRSDAPCRQPRAIRSTFV